MITELILIANELDSRKLTAEADALDAIIKKSMARPTKRMQPLAQKFKDLIRSADKELTWEQKGRVSARDISNYYIENPISINDIDTGEPLSLSLHDLSTYIRSFSNKGPMTDRDFHSLVSHQRDWKDDTSPLKGRWRSEKKKSIRSLMKMIEAARGGNNYEAQWVLDIARETGYSPQKIIGYSLAHNLDSTFGQFVSLVQKRNPGANKKELYTYVLEAMRDLPATLGSMGEDERASYRDLLNKVFSINDFALKSKKRDDDGFIIPSWAEVAYTLSVINDSSGSRSSLQAPALNSILRDVILEDIKTNGQNSMMHDYGCQKVYVPGMPKDTFSSLFKDAYITNDFIATKIAHYIEECFGLKKSPKTIHRWGVKIGLWEARREIKGSRDSVSSVCRNLQPLLNRLVCAEVSCMPKVSRADVAKHWNHTYKIMKNFLTQKDISIKRCLSEMDIGKVRSCSLNAQNKYENLKKYIDTDKEDLYSLISTEIDNASGNQGFGNEVIGLIKEYFEQNSACRPNLEDLSAPDDDDIA